MNKKLLAVSMICVACCYACNDDSASGTGECKCLESEQCVDNVCVDKASLCGGVKCLESETCVENACVATASLCGGVKCLESETCVGNACVETASLCGGVKCLDSQVCQKDVCVDKEKVCGDTACHDLQICHKGACIDKDRECGDAVCEADQTCREGGCVDTVLICGTNICTTSQTCQNSECIDNDKICGASVCTAQQTCRDGMCVDNEKICGDAVCGASQTCHEGVCVATELICGESVCEAKQSCVEGVCVDPTPAEVVITVGGAPVVSEDGSSFEIEVVLATQPTDSVTVTVTSGDTGEVALSAESLTFTADNWNVAQKLTVTGVDDDDIDGTVSVPVQFVSASADAEYDKLTTKIDVANTDNDSAALVIDSAGVTMLEGSEETAGFSVVLSARPTQNVTVTMQSSDATELSIVGESTLVFTPENWNQAQKVSVAPVDDTLADGSQTAFVQIKSASEDSNFDLLSGKTVDYTISDNETAGVVISASATEITPSASQITLDVVLTAEPSSDVVVTLISTNDVTAALGEKTVTFTSENWNVAQKVTVTNTDAMAASSVKTLEMISGTASGENVYNGTKSNTIILTIYALTKLDIVRPTECAMQEMELLPGKYKLEAWGGQGGLDGPGNGETRQGGKGGYASGYITVTEKQKIYYVIGEYSPSFNVYGVYSPCGGGGTSSGSSTGAGGGGATFIASKALGTLDKYVDDQDAIYLVAGGGGGAADYAEGGNGGGENGGNGVGTNSGAGATQTTGYKFGLGEPASGQNPGGGAGWYGGFRSKAGVHAGGGGGSGYIGGVENGEMQTGIQSGDGKIVITLVEDEVH